MRLTIDPSIAVLALLAAGFSALTAAPHHRAPLPPVSYARMPAPPRDHEPLGRVVLVHGFLETGSSFEPLEKQLTKRGFECRVIRLKPNDGRAGLEKLAADLKQFIHTEFGNQHPISVVGFSMGGLVCRYYLQNLGGAPRCKTFITISSPHQGTKAAHLYPSKGARQMRPGSQFLTDLDATADSLDGIPTYSYRTPLDLIIMPARNSIWDKATNISYTVAMHPMMLTSRRVLGDVERRLLGE